MTIEKRENKNGISFLITVTNGVDANGKKNRHYLTWFPDEGMTDRQMQKAVEKVAHDFEDKIMMGFAIDNKQTFAEYAEYVLKIKEKEDLKIRTLERYQELLQRINPAIGHLKLTDIRPAHLNAFYDNLAESGVRASAVKATPKRTVPGLINATKLSNAKFAELAGTAATNISAVKNGKTVSEKVANAVAAALGKDAKALFNFSRDTTPLSNKTILEHHRLISTIMAQAEKEMIIQYNPASKATPPKARTAEMEVFEPEEVGEILRCLDLEPIKWRTITNLLIMTGCRRGEIMGLHWDDIDEENNRIFIHRALLSSKKSGIYEDTTKTRETRYVNIPAQTMAMVQLYKKWQEGEKKKCGDLWTESDYVFTKEKGGAMYPDTITQWLNGFAQKYDLPEIHPHKFRHTLASNMICNGVDVLAVSKRLGHAKVSTTTDIYSHAIKQAEIKATETIELMYLPRKKKQA